SSAGVTLWTNRYDAGESGHINGLAVDGSGNVFVTGQPATLAYSADGVPLWTNTSSLYERYAVALDPNRNVIVTGYDQNSSDFVTVAYSSVGSVLWTNRYDGPGNGADSAYAMAVDRSGNVVVSGTSWNGSNFDFATVKYSAIPQPIHLAIAPDGSGG